MKEKERGSEACKPKGILFTWASETRTPSVNEIIVVWQYERTSLLHLQAVLPAGDLVAAVHLCRLEVLGAQPGFVDSLQKHRERER